MPVAVTVFGLCVVFCVLAHTGILRSVIRARSVNVDPPPGVRRPGLVVEIIWAVIPAVVLALVLIASWPRVRANAMREIQPSPRVDR
jgi:heme/copper-type cytochrome/quinol oxidase subunit 2